MSQALALTVAPRRARSRLWNGLTFARRAASLGVVHVGAVAAFFVTSFWWEWALLFVFLYIRGLLVTVAFHRYFSHRSFKTSRLVQFLMGFFGCANQQNGPGWWAAHHRLHHRHSDEPEDVHSPFHGGILWAYGGWVFARLEEPDWDGVRDLRRFPEVVWMDRWPEVSGLLLAGLCWWFGGWGLLCVSFCLSAVITFHVTSTFNVIGHLVGSRRYPTGDHSRNSFLLSVLTLGDGWHNNHHHYPHAAHSGFFWWEVDASFRVIRLMERVGLVWDVRRVPAHKLHPVASPEAPAEQAVPVGALSAETPV